MHTLVQLRQLTVQEFERGLEGLSGEDARKVVEPMNCISWIIGHLANQQQAYFVARPNGKEIDDNYKPYGFGSPASQPSLDEVMGLWKESCRQVDEFLLQATDEILEREYTGEFRLKENYGTLLTRHIFHAWCHIGEISSIRQILGHKPPQFVNMHDWSYGGG